MSSVMVTELQEINKKLEILNKLLIGDISEDVSVKSRTRFKTTIVAKSATIADLAAPKAANADGVVNIQESNRVIISTDGNPNDVSFRVIFADASISDEIELTSLSSLPGKFKQIQVNNDTAESGKSIFVRQFLLPPLLMDNVEGPSIAGAMGLLDASGSRIDPKTDDPFYKGGDVIDIPYSLAKRTTPVFKFLHARTQSDGVNTKYMTFESPVGTDYQVPASKSLDILKVSFKSLAAGHWVALGYGDDAVAPGNTEPTTAVYFNAKGAATNAVGIYVTVTVNVAIEYKILNTVPASKYPHMANGTSTGANNDIDCILVGVERAA